MSFGEGRQPIDEQLNCSTTASLWQLADSFGGPTSAQNKEKFLRRMLITKELHARGMIFQGDLKWPFAPALADQPDDRGATLADQPDERETGSPEDPATTAESKQAAARQQIGVWQRDLGMLQKSAGVPREFDTLETTVGGPAEPTTTNPPTQGPLGGWGIRAPKADGPVSTISQEPLTK